MAKTLEAQRVAILFTDGVEQAELEQPFGALRDAGADVDLVSLDAGPIQMFQHLEASDTIDANRAVSEAQADDYDALMLPGGVANPDRLRMDDDAVAFVRAFFDSAKPVAAICHAPWTLIEADVVDGRTLTSWPSLQTDLRNAGASSVDEEVMSTATSSRAASPTTCPRSATR